MQKLQELNQKQSFYDKQEQHIYNIITGRVKYDNIPFTSGDLSPDLVIKISVPNSKSVPRSKYLTLSHFIVSPSQKLEKMYLRAENEIIKEMEQQQQNQDSNNQQMRLQLSLVSNQMVIKRATYLNQDQQQEKIDFECVHQQLAILDVFKLQYNTIVYLLQQECGFVLKSFILYDEEVKQKAIYLFLNLKGQNLLRMASKYKIKKEVDYVFFDFYLNEPTTIDDRPIRFNSSIKTDLEILKFHKRISRYFRIKQKVDLEQIIQQMPLQNEELQNYRCFTEQLSILFDYISKKQDKLTNLQKKYIFEYNRHKINKGCQKNFYIYKKRRDYFQFLKYLLPKYGYKAEQQFNSYQQFSIPDKHSKRSTFFNKLDAILLYKPQIVGPQGQLQLFLEMEKSKLSYLTIKQVFKINFLFSIGFDIFTLNNHFQKFGEKHSKADNPIKGGLNGERLIDKWVANPFITNIKTIRNYAGQQIAYEVLTKVQALIYLTLVALPFIILQTLEYIYEDLVFVYTSQIECLIFAISFRIYLDFWQSNENKFVENYCDSKTSKISLSKFRGPFVRNPITDESNEYSIDSTAYITNFICFILISVMLMIVGAIFHGMFRFLVSIYANFQFHVYNYFSPAHLIAYGLYFLIQIILRFLIFKRVIQFMVYLKNPASDQDQRRLTDALNYYYLLGFQIIGPIFMLFIYPFMRTSCYSSLCQTQLVYFLYTRFIIYVCTSIYKLIYLFAFHYSLKKIKEKTAVAQIQQQDKLFHHKLASLLKKVLEQQKMPVHKYDKLDHLVGMILCALYCNIFPASPAVLSLIVFIQYTNLRFQMIEEVRRPLNQSNSIIKISEQLKYIYYLGIFINSWLICYTYQFIQMSYSHVVLAILPKISQGQILLFELIIVILHVIWLIVVSTLISKIALSFTSNTLYNRKNEKYKNFMLEQGALKLVVNKIEENKPLLSIFRTFNLQRGNAQKYDMMVNYNQPVDQSQENLDSAKELIN